MKKELVFFLLTLSCSLQGSITENDLQKLFEYVFFIGQNIPSENEYEVLRDTFTEAKMSNLSRSTKENIEKTLLSAKEIYNKERQLKYKGDFLLQDEAGELGTIEEKKEYYKTFFGDLRDFNNLAILQKKLTDFYKNAKYETLHQSTVEELFSLINQNLQNILSQLEKALLNLTTALQKGKI